MFNATFFIISVLLEEETGLPEKKKTLACLKSLLIRRMEGSWDDAFVKLFCLISEIYKLGVETETSRKCGK